MIIGLLFTFSFIHTPTYTKKKIDLVILIHEISHCFIVLYIDTFGNVFYGIACKCISCIYVECWIKKNTCMCKTNGTKCCSISVLIMSQNARDKTDLNTKYTHYRFWILFLSNQRMFQKYNFLVLVSKIWGLPTYICFMSRLASDTVGCLITINGCNKNTLKKDWISGEKLTRLSFFIWLIMKFYPSHPFFKIWTWSYSFPIKTCCDSIPAQNIPCGVLIVFLHPAHYEKVERVCFWRNVLLAETIFFIIGINSF